MIITSKLSEKEALALRGRSEGQSLFVERDDNAVLERLLKESESVPQGERHDCYLVLNDATTLWMMQTVGLPDSVREKFDVVAVTMEDLLAKALLVKLPNIPTAFPSLDRAVVSLQSNSTVHLLIFGFSAQAEALAINAALVAHYPNYCRDTRLRTRITIIDETILSKTREFMQRYCHLFDNSYYRVINLADANPTAVVHSPMYADSRKDFVDVEWEFVDGCMSNTAVRRKLAEWSSSDTQQLTIAMCHNEHQRNLNEALALPDEVYMSDTAVLCHFDRSRMLEFARADHRYANLYSFGRELCDIEVLRQLKALAKRVNYVYNHCFSLGEDEPMCAPSDIDLEKMERLWCEVKSMPKIYSNLFNAMTLGTKMHSLGHNSDDWAAYYALSKDEIDILTEVEHNRWSTEELILGYRPTADDEQQQIERDMDLPLSEQKDLKRAMRAHKIHYDLRSYDDLRKDATGKNVNVYDRVLTQGIPLIVKSCITD